jgi:hypothetical protein
VKDADIVATCTMAREPILRGDWLQPGQHLDLIGAFTPEMREADDDALRRARIFVDSRATTIGHIGELTIPLQAGVIDRGRRAGRFPRPRRRPRRAALGRRDHALQERRRRASGPDDGADDPGALEGGASRMNEEISSGPSLDNRATH